MKKIFFLLCFLGVLSAFGQETTLKGITKEGLFLEKNWLFSSQTSPNWEKKEFSDKNWTPINPQLWLDSVKTIFDKEGYFRLHLRLDSSLLNKAYALQIWQRGASQIYLNGKLVHRFGSVSAKSSEEQKYSPVGVPVSIYFTETENVLAVHYSSSNAYELYKSYGRYARTAGFRMKISDLENAIYFYNEETRKNTGFNLGVFSMLFSMGLLHLIIFSYYPKQRPSLYYGIFSILLSVRFLIDYFHQKEHDIDLVIYYNIINFTLINVVNILILAFLYQLFFKKIPRYFWLFPFVTLVSYISFFLNSSYTSFMIPILGGVFVLEFLRVVIQSFFSKKTTTWAVGAGMMMIVLILFLLSSSIRSFGLQFLFPVHINMVIDTAGILGITLIMSIFLAREIANANAELEVQLTQVQALSLKNIEQERFTKQILENQNHILEEQVLERTSEIQEKSVELSIQNEEIAAQRDSLKEKSQALENAYTHITDSVRYAERIQKALLGNPEDILKYFDEAFIFFKPKNIVSGDFYWFAQVQAQVPEQEILYPLNIVIAADCTGHGVPGAFMTVMGNNFLNDIIYTQQILSPDQILYSLDQQIRGVFRTRNQTNEMHIQDGMDMAVLLIDSLNGIAHYAGAKNPLFVAREGKIVEIKASRFPIGSEQYRTQKVFEPHAIQLQEDDVLYLFSDGFTDQFGMKTQRRYMKKRFRAFLEEISHLPMNQQKRFIEEELEEWSPSYLNQQTDDILVIGLRINLMQMEEEPVVGFKL